MNKLAYVLHCTVVAAFSSLISLPLFGQTHALVNVKCKCDYNIVFQCIRTKNKDDTKDVTKAPDKSKNDTAANNKSTSTDTPDRSSSAKTHKPKNDTPKKASIVAPSNSIATHKSHSKKAKKKKLSNAKQHKAKSGDTAANSRSTSEDTPDGSSSAKTHEPKNDTPKKASIVATSNSKVTHKSQTKKAKKKKLSNAKQHKAKSGVRHEAVAKKVAKGAAKQNDKPKHKRQFKNLRPRKLFSPKLAKLLQVERKTTFDTVTLPSDDVQPNGKLNIGSSETVSKKMIVEDNILNQSKTNSEGSHKTRSQNVKTRSKRAGSRTDKRKVRELTNSHARKLSRKASADSDNTPTSIPTVSHAIPRTYPIKDRSAIFSDPGKRGAFHDTPQDIPAAAIRDDIRIFITNDSHAVPSKNINIHSTKERGGIDKYRKPIENLKDTVNTHHLYHKDDHNKQSRIISNSQRRDRTPKHRYEQHKKTTKTANRNSSKKMSQAIRNSVLMYKNENLKRLVKNNSEKNFHRNSPHYTISSKKHTTHSLAYTYQSKVNHIDKRRAKANHKAKRHRVISRKNSRQRPIKSSFKRNTDENKTFRNHKTPKQQRHKTKRLGGRNHDSNNYGSITETEKYVTFARPKRRSWSPKDYDSDAIQKRRRSLDYDDETARNLHIADAKCTMRVCVKKKCTSYASKRLGVIEHTCVGGKKNVCKICVAGSCELYSNK